MDTGVVVMWLGWVLMGWGLFGMGVPFLRGGEWTPRPIPTPIDSLLSDLWKIQGFIFSSIMLQVALVALATNPSFHKELLSTVKSWPPVIYSALPVISAIEPQLNTSSMTDALKEVTMVFLYLIYGFCPFFTSL